MKKIAVVICIFLSLFIISCAEPDNAPDKSENPQETAKEIELVVNVDIFPEEKRADIKKIEFSYTPVSAKALANAIKVDVSPDGKANIRKIKISKDKSIEYTIKGFDLNDIVVAQKSGKLNIQADVNVYAIDKTTYVPNGCVRIFNPDVHYVGGQRYLLIATSLKQPSKDNPGKKPDDSGYWSNNITVSEGEYTVVDGLFEFLREQGSIELQIINERTLTQSNGDSLVDRMQPYMIATLVYEKGKSDYIINSSNVRIDGVLNELEYQIVIKPKGEFLDEMKYIYFHESDDFAHNGNAGTMHKTAYDNSYIYNDMKLYSGRPYEFYVMGLNKDRIPITEMKKVTFRLPASNDKSICLKPELIPRAKLIMVNPNHNITFLTFTITALKEDGSADSSKFPKNLTVGADEASLITFVDAGKYHFICKPFSDYPDEKKPKIVFDVMAKETLMITPEFGDSPKVKIEKLK